MKPPGDNRAHEDRGARAWFCRACNAPAYSPYVPAGWYTLERRAVGQIDGHNRIRLGAYCSATCLGRMLPKLIRIEGDLQ